MVKTQRAGLPRVAPFRIYFPFLFWLVTIFLLSAYPKAIIPQSKYISWDKIAHILEYAVLGYLTSRAAYFSGSRFLSNKYLWIGVLFGIIYAISDEIHQLYVPGRLGSPFDLLADSIGVLAGIWVFRRSVHKKATIPK